MSILNYKKKRKVNTIIKVFKVVNLDEAKKYRIRDTFKLCGKFFKENIGVFPNSTSINYQSKTWKTYNGFLKGIADKKDWDIVWLYSGYNERNNQNVFVINNSMMNYNVPPKKDVITVSISIESQKVNQETIVKFLKQLCNIMSFEYGYWVELDERYDFGNERKVKKGVFGSTVESKEIDYNWVYGSIGISEGFIKKLYKCNILNHSQLNQPEIKSLIGEGVGKLKEFNDYLSIWTLTDDEFEHANVKLNQSKYVIYNEGNPDLFLQTEEAKKFKDLAKAN